MTEAQQITALTKTVGALHARISMLKDDNNRLKHLVNFYLIWATNEQPGTDAAFTEAATLKSHGMLEVEEWVPGQTVKA